MRYIYPDSIAAFDFWKIRHALEQVLPLEVTATGVLQNKGPPDEGKVSPLLGCFFCEERMTAFPAFHPGPTCGFFERFDYDVVQICPNCGWWVYYQQGHEETPYEESIARDSMTYASFDYTRCIHFGALRVFDKRDVEAPVEEVRRFLLAKYDQRNNIHPRLFEEVVTSVFRDMGFAAELTSYHADGGIDVILRHGDDEICVQVKRYGNKIGVEEIRAFLGAMVLKDYQEGIFVTTSDYTMGAKKAADESGTFGYAIKLVDQQRLLDYLKCTARPPYTSREDWMAAQPRLERPAFSRMKGGEYFQAMG